MSKCIFFNQTILVYHFGVDNFCPLYVMEEAENGMKYKIKYFIKKVT
jgi:hypothetical protein